MITSGFNFKDFLTNKNSFSDSYYYKYTFTYFSLFWNFSLNGDIFIETEVLLFIIFLHFSRNNYFLIFRSYVLKMRRYEKTPFVCLSDAVAVCLLTDVQGWALLCLSVQVCTLYVIMYRECVLCTHSVR